MNNKIASLAFGLILAAGSAAIAGPYYAPTKGPMIPPMQPLDPGCICFDDTELALDLFGVGVFGDGSEIDDAIGGGLGLTTFVNPYIGFSASIFWWDNHSAIHNVTGSVIVRAPITEACLAPYVFGGVGGYFDAVNQVTWHAGGGIEFKLPDANCLGIFADGAYHWADETDNYTVARLGVRIKL
ncbi:hypothetical protein BH23VER1_BH23VER1_34440 [soil metagenome]